MKLNLSLAVLVLASACHPSMEYGMRVNSKMQFKPSPSDAEVKVLPAGDYVAKLTSGISSSKITLVNAAKQKVSFKTKRLDAIANRMQSRESMSIVLDEAMLGQPFKISMKKVKSLVQVSREETRSEECVLGSHQETTTHCTPAHQECDDYDLNSMPNDFGDREPRNGGRSNHYRGPHQGNHGHGHCTFVPERCWNETQTVTDYGSRTVRGNDNYYRTVTTLTFLQNGKSVAAIAPIKDSYREFDRTDTGACR